MGALGALGATITLAAGFVLPGAGAARTSTIPGIVDVYTNLGYQSAEAAGTGIVLTSSGEILTNNHVIRGATTIKVVDLDNHHSYKAKVVGYTVSGDVAVLQLKDASGLARRRRSKQLLLRARRQRDHDPRQRRRGRRGAEATSPPARSSVSTARSRRRTNRTAQRPCTV